ncbi:MAG: extracellular solute-binding protein [Desulfobacterales bacterium]|jgi:iron(III) transport system substrate-binding protein|nr:extracellular solute-binding protein [Desulfobacterales bacterium]
MKRLAAILVIVLTGTLASAADPALLEKARAEKKAAFYANITAVEPILEAFGKAYGVSAEYTRVSTNKFVATVLTEHQAGKLLADVVQAPLPILDILKEKGVLASYRPAAMAGYPAWAARDEKIQLFGIEYVAPIYNKDLVKPADVPRKYEDLADPKWRGKIVMADPSTHATTISWLIGLKEKVFPSEEAWMAFVKGLAANQPMFVNSFGPTPAPVESGEKLIAISMPKYIITKAPAPLDWARVAQPLLGTPRAMALTAAAPHPHAARLFIDYWLSKEAMKIMAEKVGEYVLAPGVFPPIDGMDKARVEPIRELSDDEIRRWGGEFKKIFATP